MQDFRFHFKFQVVVESFMNETKNAFTGRHLFITRLPSWADRLCTCIHDPAKELFIERASFARQNDRGTTVLSFVSREEVTKKILQRRDKKWKNENKVECRGKAIKIRLTFDIHWRRLFILRARRGVC